MTENKYSNALISEKSPYLLQHAHNPVNWHTWGDEAFAKAKKEDKLVLISIGYSACHWCHVMEHECFEDEEVAAVMNKHFINIKVDREERPDVDHIYMTAVQLMTRHGGWPLNCFSLPDGRPVYGGTYFPKAQWTDLLHKLAKLYKEEKNKTEEYAAQLADGIRQSDEVVQLTEREAITREELSASILHWQKRFDRVNGGNIGAPKFPMPNNYLYLLRYARLNNDENISDFVHHTLKKMAYGGIYDQLGGGFARYSVDEYWKVPHFEKMLYDNAQLISLYSEAYRHTKNELYKEVVYDTIAFVEKELASPEDGFYSALDADSEGVEGKFYVWEEHELKELLQKDFNLFAEYYNVNEAGYWEDENYILLRDEDEALIAGKNDVSVDELRKVIHSARTKLLDARNKRIRPGLDDKILAGWNGLMCKALCDAHEAFNEDKFLELAEKNISFIAEKLFKHGALYHCYKEEAYIKAFLDDHAFIISAFVKLFLLNGKEQYIRKAEELVSYCMAHFYDAEKHIFYFSGKENAELISRKAEMQDNVIPASNSQMALNLFALSRINGNASYEAIAGKMLLHVKEELLKFPQAYSNWGVLALAQAYPFYEVAVIGEKAAAIKNEFSEAYLPNALVAYAASPSQLPLFQNRYVKHETLIYVCSNHSCRPPVTAVKEATALVS